MKKFRKKKEKLEKTLSKREQERIAAERKRNVIERVAKYRKQLKEASSATLSSSASPPFKSRSSLGKAISKVKRVLPASPRKQKCVIRRLYHTFVEPLAVERISRPKISAETISAVTNFYERDDISRQAPGRKDVVTVKGEKGKNKLQVRHLMYYLKEAHAMFCEENGKVIGKSKFAELRPKHVLLANKLPHNVCLCKYHENFICAVNSLHSIVPQIPEYTSNLPEFFLCAEPAADCWLGNCIKCKDLMSVKLLDLCIGTQEYDVKWYVWQESYGRILKVEEEGTVRDLVDHILTMGPKFLEHCYFKREQSKSYQCDRASLPSSMLTAMMQIDFSENFTCVNQDEIQSAHWQQNQMSIFTAMIWHSGTSHSYVLVSDNLDHTKNTVVPYVDRLLEELPNNIRDVTIWSDGPASQFKNRYIAEALKVLSKSHGKRLTWKYFATSHGKGPVDGIGGAVKRQVWTRVKSRKCIVNNATDFVKALLNSSSDVTAILMGEEDFSQRSKKLHLPALIKKLQAFLEHR